MSDQTAIKPRHSLKILSGLTTASKAAGKTTETWERIEMEDWKKEFVRLLFPVDRNEINIETAHKLKYKNFPEFLYRYREYNSNNLSALKNDKIWLSCPAKYNDPFDSAVCFASGQGLLFDKKRLIIEELRKSGSFSEDQLAEINKSDNFIDLLAEYASKDICNDLSLKNCVMNGLNKTYSSFLDTMSSDFTREIQKNTFVACFSEIYNSICMWSHYARQHTGFCIEYCFSEFVDPDPRIRSLYPVIYCNDLFDVTRFLRYKMNNGEFNNLLAIYAAMCKSSEWSSEKEWRWIFPFGEELKPDPITMPSPTKVYLGAKISENHENEITKICEDKRIEVIKLRLDAFSFNLIPINAKEADL